MKITEGTWVEVQGYDCKIISTKENPEFIVATVWYDDDKPKDEVEYNSKLISKAPEMLGLLEKILKETSISNLYRLKGNIKKLITEIENG